MVRPPPQICHASCVRYQSRGVLIKGPSGAGKTALVAEIILAGGYLVADDLVALEPMGRGIIATAVSPASLMAIRGLGLVRPATLSHTRLDLVVRLQGRDGDASQAAMEDPLPKRVLADVAGQSLPCLDVPSPDGSNFQPMLSKIAFSAIMTEHEA